MLLSDFSATTAADSQLQLSIVPRRSTTILDAKGNVTGEAQVLECRLLDSSLYYDYRNRHGALASVNNRERLGLLIRVQAFSVRKAHVSESSSGKVPFLPR